MPALPRTLALSLLICGLTACAAAPLRPALPGNAARCGEQRVDRLLFGLNSPDGPISDEEWQRFLSDTVTPRFPDGLTIYQTRGQWRGESGTIEREESRVVEIAHPDDDAGRQRIAEIVATYKTRYKQEAVLVVSTRAMICL